MALSKFLLRPSAPRPKYRLTEAERLLAEAGSGEVEEA